MYSSPHKNVPTTLEYYAGSTLEVACALRSSGAPTWRSILHVHAYRMRAAYLRAPLQATPPVRTLWAEYAATSTLKIHCVVRCYYAYATPAQRELFNEGYCMPLSSQACTGTCTCMYMYIVHIYMYIVTCRLMRRQIKVANPPTCIFLIPAAYMHIRDEVVDEYQTITLLCEPAASLASRRRKAAGSLGWWWRIGRFHIAAVPP